MKKILLSVFLALAGITYSQTCNLSFNVIDSDNQLTLSNTGNFMKELGVLNLRIETNTANDNYYYKITKGGQSTIQTTTTFQLNLGFDQSFDVQTSIGHPDTAKCTVSNSYVFKYFITGAALTPITRDGNTLKFYAPITLQSIYKTSIINATTFFYKDSEEIQTINNNYTLTNSASDDGNYNYTVQFSDSKAMLTRYVNTPFPDYVIKTPTAIDSKKKQSDKTLLKTYNLQGQEIANESKGAQFRVFSDGSRDKVFVE